MDLVRGCIFSFSSTFDDYKGRK